jgi:hypothetical protein
MCAATLYVEQATRQADTAQSAGHEHPAGNLKRKSSATFRILVLM